MRSEGGNPGDAILRGRQQLGHFAKFRDLARFICTLCNAANRFAQAHRGSGDDAIHRHLPPAELVTPIALPTA